MASKVREIGYPVTCFQGEGLSGPVTELYILCRRRDLNHIVQVAQEIEQDVFFVTESVGIMRSGNRRELFHGANNKVQ
jgi:uncharacterized protein YebE (UPF0316 family)